MAAIIPAALSSPFPGIVMKMLIPRLSPAVYIQISNFTLHLSLHHWFQDVALFRLSDCFSLYHISLLHKYCNNESQTTL